MTLAERLDTLELSGLIRMAHAAPDPEYLFRHALVQDAAYASLLKQDRRRLHLAIGEVLERDFSSRLEEFAPLLGHHFAEAGDHARALKYFGIAGAQAMRHYAISETITFYSRAVEMARQIHSTDQLPALLRQRGLAFEARGNFEQANADHEAALQVAQGTHNQRAEWQAQLDLGMLWSGRDYAQTQRHYEAANALARDMEDLSSVAHTLNHLGNLHTNVEHTDDAIREHEKALAIFEGLEDQQGIAETTDFLGMAVVLGGDMSTGISHLRHAIELFRRLDDRRRLASALGAASLRSANYETNTLPTTGTLDEALQDGEAALAIAREIGSRADEAFSLCANAANRASQGNYARALSDVQECLSIAHDIGHRQWMTMAHAMLGGIYLDLFAFDEARAHLEQATAMAMDINSWFWIRVTAGFYGSVCVAQGDLARAEAVLDTALSPGVPARTLGQRLAWCARGDLALARGDAESALRVSDRLIADCPHAEDGRSMLRVCALRGNALAALRQPEQAMTEWHAARAIAEAQGANSMLWRIYAALSGLHRARGDSGNATYALAKARGIATTLASNIPEESVRRHFVTQAEALLARQEVEP